MGYLSYRNICLRESGFAQNRACETAISGSRAAKPAYRQRIALPVLSLTRHAYTAVKRRRKRKTENGGMALAAKVAQQRQLMDEGRRKSCFRV